MRTRADGSVFAVKRLSPMYQTEFPYLIDNEVKGLTQANYCKIPRMVKFEELVVLPGGDARVILE